MELLLIIIKYFYIILTVKITSLIFFIYFDNILVKNYGIKEKFSRDLSLYTLRKFYLYEYSFEIGFDTALVYYIEIIELVL